MEAQTVAKIVTNEVICRFGCPVTIHSDQGRQYESFLFAEVCKLLQIRKTRTTSYHPQSDGMVERFNKTLATMLSAYVDENHRDWDESLPYVMMAYRASQHESTGYSPNMLMLGREVTTPLEIMFDMPSSWKEVPRNEWVWILKDRMERAHALVRRHAEGAMFRQKHYHDMKMSYEKFKEGDKVVTEVWSVGRQQYSIYCIPTIQLKLRVFRIGLRTVDETVVDAGYMTFPQPIITCWSAGRG
ncbi:uncharacterized protein LOC130054495 [Ostrea edulis]|uniref:uncharacterized protein LOC130054495 n=1 Tax=Ostrea edulis TaxID=37623 RepID=UPI0024AF9D34|nr:uncharacterized protein LOC130054495 [Ostrea edulis]